MDADGNFAVIGAVTNDRDSTEYAGRAFSFKQNTDGLWTLKQPIILDEAEADHVFNVSIAIDEDQLVIGANSTEYDSHGNARLWAGSARLFNLDTDDEWQLAHKFLSPNLQAFDSFGSSVACHKNVVIAGVVNDEDDESESNPIAGAGSIYAFLNTVSTPTTDLISAEFDLKLSPNPASTFINLEIARIPVGDAMIGIWDMTGVRILSGRVNATNTRLDISHLGTGAFIATLEAGGQILDRVSFIKQ